MSAVTIRGLEIGAPLPLMTNRETAPETGGREIPPPPCARLAGPRPLGSAPGAGPQPRLGHGDPSLPAPAPKAGQGRAPSPASGWGRGPERLPGEPGEVEPEAARGGWARRARRARLPRFWRIGNRLGSCAARWSSVSRCERGRERRRAGGGKGREAAPRPALRSRWPRGNVQSAASRRGQMAWGWLLSVSGENLVGEGGQWEEVTTPSPCYRPTLPPWAEGKRRHAEAQRWKPT